MVANRSWRMAAVELCECRVEEFKVSRKEGKVLEYSSIILVSTESEISRS